MMLAGLVDSGLQDYLEATKKGNQIAINGVCRYIPPEIRVFQQTHSTWTSFSDVGPMNGVGSLSSIIENPNPV